MCLASARYAICYKYANQHEQAPSILAIDKNRSNILLALQSSHMLNPIFLAFGSSAIYDKLSRHGVTTELE